MRTEVYRRSPTGRKFVLSYWYRTSPQIPSHYKPPSHFQRQNLYNNVTYMYPEANIWVIGTFGGHFFPNSDSSLIVSLK